MGAGESTQGKLLAEALGLPQCSMDEIRWDYYREMGFDDEKQREIGEKEGFERLPVIQGCGCHSCSPLY